MKKLLVSCLSALLLLAHGTVEANPQGKESVFKLSTRMKEAIITQVAREQYSSNLYLSFASYFADIGLDGCEAFFRKQAEEEAEHALLFYNLLLDRNERFNLIDVAASTVLPSSPTDAFIRLYENEKEVSSSILNLYNLSLEEKDPATQTFLQPFLLLQVEEERDAEGFVQALSLSSADDPTAILFLNAKFEEEFKD